MNRDYRGPFTSEELRLMTAYRLAGDQIMQNYKKMHTPAEADAFSHLDGKYEMDRTFYLDWNKRLIGTQGHNRHERRRI